MKIFLIASFWAVYCFICSRRRVAVARYRMICLVLVTVLVTILPFCFISIWEISLQIISTLLSNSCPLDTRDEDGNTPLHIAAEYVHINPHFVVWQALWNNMVIYPLWYFYKLNKAMQNVTSIIAWWRESVGSIECHCLVFSYVILMQGFWRDVTTLVETNQ